jgi:anti-sigma factor RsiW
MNCQQAREILEDTFGGEQSNSDHPEVQAHLEGCHACQDWLARQRRAIDALEQLEPFPTPPDFTRRVLAQLPDEVPESEPAPAPQREGFVHRLRRGWQEFLSWLARPPGRRQLVPALVAAVSLILVLGLLSALQTEGVETTPGAVVGQVPWLALAGLVLVAAGVVVAVLFWGRKK